jgi:hypothetical protein
MLSTRSRSLATVAAGALVLVSLAGCGSDDKTKDAKSASSSSPSESSSATADPTVNADDIDVSGAAAPGKRLTKDNLVATMIAAMREKKTAHMSMQIGSSVDADADLRYGGDATDMKMAMTMGPTKATVILVDGVMYLQQAAGSKFVKIGKDDPTLGSMLDQMSSFGPESSVAAMKDALKKVEYVGTDTVDGEKLTEYKVTVDTDAVAGTLGGVADSEDLPKTVTYQLYVDNDHLMRRIDMTVSEQKVSMKITDWGEPVEIEAPPASKVQ